MEFFIFPYFITLSVFISSLLTLKIPLFRNNRGGISLLSDGTYPSLSTYAHRRRSHANSHCNFYLIYITSLYILFVRALFD